MSDAYVARVAALRAEYNAELLALEERYEGLHARMGAVYRAKFVPRNGDSRALYDALAMTCMESAWAPHEAEFQAAKDALFTTFQERCAEARKELGL